MWGCAAFAEMAPGLDAMKINASSREIADG
jgi:hypothetical protein